jgi:hypothetical protein
MERQYGEIEPVRDEFFKFYQYVNALDLGWSDFTVVLWMYWDFKNAQLVVEDEYAVRGPNMTTDFLTSSIKDKENHAVDDEEPMRTRWWTPAWPT